jgi:hypothetical protein
VQSRELTPAESATLKALPESHDEAKKEKKQQIARIVKVRQEGAVLAKVAKGIADAREHDCTFSLMPPSFIDQFEKRSEQVKQMAAEIPHSTHNLEAAHLEVMRNGDLNRHVHEMQDALAPLNESVHAGWDQWEQELQVQLEERAELEVITRTMMEGRIKNQYEKHGRYVTWKTLSVT